MNICPISITIIQHYKCINVHDVIGDVERKKERHLRQIPNGKMKMRVASGGMYSTCNYKTLLIIIIIHFCLILLISFLISLAT